MPSTFVLSAMTALALATYSLRTQAQVDIPPGETGAIAKEAFMYAHAWMEYHDTENAVLPVRASPVSTPLAPDIAREPLPGTGSSPPQATAEQESRVADKTGTDPSNFQRTMSPANKYADLARGGAYLNSTTLSYIQPLNHSRARFLLELPFAVTHVSGHTDRGLADLSVRYGQILYLDRQKAFAAGFGLVAPTATNDSLGLGKWSLEPSASVIVLLSPEWIVAPSFKQTVSVGGNSDRADVNLSTFDFYLVWRARSLTQWVILDPAFAWNWKSDGNHLAGITTLTYGHILGRTGSAVWSAYLKPGIGWGNGRASNWSVEAGVKVVAFLSAHDTTACHSESCRSWQSFPSGNPLWAAANAAT